MSGPLPGPLPGPLRVAIIGSRRRQDRAAVEAFVATLPGDAVVISGGAPGPDRFAEAAAQARGLPVVVHRPDLASVRSYPDAARRYHARNQRIVDDADLVVAFVAPDRKGGTEDAIRRARRAGKRVLIREPGGDA